MTTKRAMIVGVNEYDDKTIPNLKGAENDAHELKRILEDDGDFEVAHEDDRNHYLTGPRATSEAIRRGISQLLWDTDKVDLTLFFFSGHGFRDSYGTGYLAPCDMDKSEPLVHGIDMQWLKTLALNSPNKNSVVLVLDCCYAGIAADQKGDEDAGDVPNQYFSDFADMGPVKQKDPTGIYVFSSSAGDETSRELTDCEHRLALQNEQKGPHAHGVLTFHMLEGLLGAASHQQDGEISVGALIDYLDDNLRPAYQTFESYSARASQSDRIILARASTMHEINAGLKQIRANLDSGKLEELIVGAVDLSKMLEEQPRLEAQDLRDRVEADLQHCKSLALQWMVKKKIELIRQLGKPEEKKVADDLAELVRNLSLQRIARERQQREFMLGLLVSLVQAVEKGYGTDYLVPDLLAAHSLAAEAPVAPPIRQKSGGKGGR